MIHDLIGVKESAYAGFKENINEATLKKGDFWVHTNNSPHGSISLKLDKYVTGELKKYIESKKPEQGAFAKKSIKVLLDVHAQHKYVLITDIRHFFASIDYGMVREEIAKCALPKELSDIIEQLYFNHEGVLKRGLKASPVISELIGLRMDSILNSEIYRITTDRPSYSRYYDDITVSSDERETLNELRKVIASRLDTELGLELNDRKTKLIPLQGSKVLGLRFHNSKITVPNNFRKKIRAMQHRYDNTYHDTESLDGVHESKSAVGTIIGSIRYFLDNSDERYLELEDTLADYYDELNRLEEIRKELTEEGAEYGE
jgi:hypothetical protein